MKKSTFNIQTKPEKKNKLSNVVLIIFLFSIPLPRTWDLKSIETKNQNEIKIVFK